MILDVDWSPLISVGFIVLVPLVPAVLLYKLFEQKTLVSGPFKGLRLDLSGAFAGYFLVLLVCGGLVYGPAERSKNYKDLIGKYENQISKLTAQLQDESEMGKAWTVNGYIVPKGKDKKMDGVGIAIEGLPRFDSNGRFEIRVAKNKSGGIATFPSLRFSKPGYYPETVHLEPLPGKLNKAYDKTLDERQHLLSIDTMIELIPEQEPDASSTKP